MVSRPSRPISIRSARARRRERAPGCGQLDAHPAFRWRPAPASAPASALDLGEPGGDPHEAWPPHRGDLRLGGEPAEMARADPSSSVAGSAGQRVGPLAHELVEHGMDDLAPFGTARVGVERIERSQGTGCGWHRPRRDRASAARCRTPRARAAGPRAVGAARAVRPGVEARPAASSCAAQAAISGPRRLRNSRRVQHRLQPHEPARRYGGRSVLVLGRAAEHHFRRARRGNEVLRGDAYRLLGRRQAQTGRASPG